MPISDFPEKKVVRVNQNMNHSQNSREIIKIMRNQLSYYLSKVVYYNEQVPSSYQSFSVQTFPYWVLEKDFHFHLHTLNLWRVGDVNMGTILVCVEFETS